MKRKIKDRLYVSTMSEDAAACSQRYGVGLELAQYCTAWNMDREFEKTDREVRRMLQGRPRLFFHGPFNELCPAAIDPKVRELSMERYRQAAKLMMGYGITNLVLHSGFTPLIYYPQWFIPESIAFWKRFLAGSPEPFTVYLENVMEPGPDLIAEIVEGVDDPRFRMCLDIGHANASESKTPVLQWIDRCREIIGHVHLHNNEGGWDIHAPLDQGTIPMPQVLDRLTELPVTFTVENLKAEPSLRYLLQEGYI